MHSRSTPRNNFPVTSPSAALQGFPAFTRYAIAFLFLLLFLPADVSARSAPDPDSTKKQLDINDPANPDCPCHQHQKQAEEEYRRMMGQNTNEGDSASHDVELENDPVDHETVTNTGDSRNLSKTKSWKKLKWAGIKKWKRRLGNKHHGTKRHRFNINGCYHW